MPMNSNYTNHDLVLFLYDELKPDRAKEVSFELMNDAQLQAEYNKLEEIKRKLENEGYDPHPTSISLIMDYSNSYHSATEQHFE